MVHTMRGSPCLWDYQLIRGSCAAGSLWKGRVAPVAARLFDKLASRTRSSMSRHAHTIAASLVFGLLGSTSVLEADYLGSPCLLASQRQCQARPL